VHGLVGRVQTARKRAQLGRARPSLKIQRRSKSDEAIAGALVGLGNGRGHQRRECAASGKTGEDLRGSRAERSIVRKVLEQSAIALHHFR